MRLRLVQVEFCWFAVRGIPHGLSFRSSRPNGWRSSRVLSDCDAGGSSGHCPAFTSFGRVERRCGKLHAAVMGISRFAGRRGGRCGALRACAHSRPNAPACSRQQPDLYDRLYSGSFCCAGLVSEPASTVAEAGAPGQKTRSVRVRLLSSSQRAGQAGKRQPRRSSQGVLYRAAQRFQGRIAPQLGASHELDQPHDPRG